MDYKQCSLLFCFFLFFTTILHANAHSQEIVQCPATNIELTSVDFSAAQCVTTSFSNFNMQSQSVWVRFTMQIPLSLLNNDRPIGLFLSGNMNAGVYLDKVKIGEKGKPALIDKEELPGPFDWVVYIPKKNLQAAINSTNQGRELVGENQLDVLVHMHLSNFHDYETANYYFNRLYFDDYLNATQKQFSNYWLSLIPLGILFVSLVFLISQWWIRSLKKSSSTPASNIYLLLMTMVASCQLLIEISRGLFAYDYPIHHFRLQAIWILALIFGHLLLLQAVQSFHQVKSVIAVIVSLFIVFIVHIFIVGENQDFRATTSVQIPAFIATLIIFYCTWNKAKRKQLPAWVLLIFCLIIFLFPDDFLDVYMYYSMALLLTFMLSYQSYIQNKLQLVLNNERLRADKLQLALDLNSTKSSTLTISLKDAGKTIVCVVDEILYCKGAGDYVEVVKNEQKILHSGSLHKLADTLPSSFIKIHRSYIVNVKFITQLARLPSGNGEITLSNQEKIPVSRRLLPTLKTSLDND